MTIIPHLARHSKRQQDLTTRNKTWCMIKIFPGGGQGWWHLQTPSLLQTTFGRCFGKINDPCFKMFWKDQWPPPHPHFKHLSLLPPPHPPPLPPKNFDHTHAKMHSTIYINQLCRMWLFPDHSPGELLPGFGVYGYGPCLSRGIFPHKKSDNAYWFKRKILEQVEFA